MAPPLAPLRRNLEISPSPLEGRPGFLIHDPLRFSRGMIVVPPQLAPALAFFDGSRTEAELGAALSELAGEDATPLVEHLTATLSNAGFLDDERFATMREERLRAFADSPLRLPAHAGNAYPAEAEALTARLTEYMSGRETDAGAGAGDGLVGIAAPHVSPHGGWESYRAAYRALGPEHHDRTFVVLGTSHYGAPERFGLTRKPFQTPLGDTTVDAALVDRLAGAGPEAVLVEDYAHAVEHSVEFQVLFLQHLYGADVKVVPVLCGPFLASTIAGGLPEDTGSVARFFDTLRGAAVDDPRLLFVMGVDMAHVGRRYGDEFDARVGSAALADVAERDGRRLARIAEGDAAGFWALVQEESDPLKWCGASALYTFLAVARPVTGELLRYEQWNIDEQSVVSFAGLSFKAAPRPAAHTKGYA